MGWDAQWSQNPPLQGFLLLHVFTSLPLLWVLSLLSLVFSLNRYSDSVQTHQSEFELRNTLAWYHVHHCSAAPVDRPLIRLMHTTRLVDTPVNLLLIKTLPKPGRFSTFFSQLSASCFLLFSFSFSALFSLVSLSLFSTCVSHPTTSHQINVDDFCNQGTNAVLAKMWDWMNVHVELVYRIKLWV